MKKLISLLKLSLTRDIMYRTNFWTTIVSRIGFLIITILWFTIMYDTLLHVKDWGYSQTLFFLATFQLIETITVAFFGNSFASWHEHIRSGSLDTLITKPLDIQLTLSLQAISLPNLLTILAPMVLIVSLNTQAHLITSLGILILYIVSIFLGVTIFYSVWLTLMTILFWFIGVEHWSNIFHSLTGFMQVPPIIYEGIIKVLFYYILPIFAAVLLPVQFIFTQDITKLGYLAIISIVSLVLSRVFFLFGLKSYSSASS
jgi:ABC-2 type transport system permease protein